METLSIITNNQYKTLKEHIFKNTKNISGKYYYIFEDQKFTSNDKPELWQYLKGYINFTFNQYEISDIIKEL